MLTILFISQRNVFGTIRSGLNGTDADFLRFPHHVGMID